MNHLNLRTSPDKSHAWQARQAEAAASQRQALALRQRHEQLTAQLRAALPFTWQVSQVRPRRPVPTCYQFGPPAFHLQLLEPLALGQGRQAVSRAAGDWLCRPALDRATGELRYESEPVPDYDDGSGGPSTAYRPAPNCKHCLKLAHQLYPASPLI